MSTEGFTPHLTFDHERTRPHPPLSTVEDLAIYKKMDLSDSFQEIDEYDVRLLAIGGFILFCNECDPLPLQFFGPFGPATKVTYWERPDHGIEMHPVTGDILGMREGRHPEHNDVCADWKATGKEERKAWKP